MSRKSFAIYGNGTLILNESFENEIESIDECDEWTDEDLRGVNLDTFRRLEQFEIAADQSDNTKGSN